MKFLSKYLEFLFEAVSKQEMRLYYSDEFRNILKNMPQSGIAQSLLTSEDSNQMLDIYTLIDITEKNLSEIDKINLHKVDYSFLLEIFTRNLLYLGCDYVSN